MYKELVISIFLIVVIMIGDKITQDYTQKSVETITDDLSSLKQELIKKQDDIVYEKLEEIGQKWDKMHNKLAYYIEHDELEKVETNFTACKSFAQTQNYDLAITELEKTIFVLDHITDKYSFSLENIF